MRRLDKEITDPLILNEILTKSRVCRIAFAIDGTPHIFPVNFGYKNNRIYIHSSTEGSKIDMVAKNNHICFEMELHDEIVRAKKACGWTTKYRSVIGWGTISMVKTRDEKIHGLNIIMEKYEGPTDDYPDAMLDKTNVLVIEIEKFTGKQSGRWE